jgi:hypothetical protein
VNSEYTAQAQEEAEVYTLSGLLGGVRDFFYNSSPRQSEVISEAGAIGYLLGICGNAYNVSATGLNQYIAYLAPTGVGKDANSEGFSKLNAAIWTSAEPFPHSGAELVSAPGLIKWMSRFPCNTTIISEWPKKLIKWNDPKSAHDYAISRVILQMYSKSGKHGSFDPMAYSDPDKVTQRIRRVSLTTLAEGTTEGFLEVIGQSQVGDGLLPRFMVAEHKGHRSYINKGHDKAVPGNKLTADLQSFLAQCNSIRISEQRVYDVPLTDLAEDKFDEFDRWTTDAINHGGDATTKQLWNRAHLKALKLAALAAVSENWTKPQIRLAHAVWATNLIAIQTNNLIARFNNGEVGEQTNNQIKQRAHILKHIAGYFAFRPTDAKLGQMWELGIIPQSYIQRKVFTLPAFQPKPTEAIKTMLWSMHDNGELRGVTLREKKIDSAAKAFQIKDHSILKDYWPERAEYEFQYWVQMLTG